MSNEREFPEVIPELKKTIHSGGVYLGVGPEQNFTYIAATQPRIAFIFDIRRENMLEHLMYKALFEMSADRAQFLSRLFSRKPSTALNSQSTVRALFQAIGGAPPDDRLHAQTLQAIQDSLTRDHHFQLSSRDLTSIAQIYDEFFNAGPGAGSFFGSFGGYGGGNYAALMTATDDQGMAWSYLSSEENFRIVKELHRKNLIVPLVGDFAGPKAIRSVAKYLKDRQATASVFYTSNVEQYLFQQGDDWRRYYSNVATLPIEPSSVFIRSSHFAYGAAQRRLQQFGGANYYMLIGSIGELVKAFTAAQIRTYDDVIRLCH